ncbi:hypothetical protein [Kribbella sp. NBC_00889]|uniref:hypothetical protein n=1 Tax=Kribbella sp. NBC_00889 TaxID=2975974 RepID=UPI00386EBEC1|nr:hypothetical protein OG817_00245 [Kribbella sp. NBC_00889]
MAALLLLSTALLVLGVVLEHRGEEAGPQNPTASEPAGHDEEGSHTEGADERGAEASTPVKAQRETALGRGSSRPARSLPRRSLRWCWQV